MADTPRLGFPEITVSQASKYVTHNESLQALDALVQTNVKDRTTTPPGSPTHGYCYLVTAVATGDWAGHENDIAQYYNGGWEFYSPFEGWVIHVEDENVLLIYSNSAWRDFTYAVDLSDYVLLDGRAGGQTICGGTASGGDLILHSTSADESGDVKGKIYLGDNSVYDEANDYLGIGLSDPETTLHFVGANAYYDRYVDVAGASATIHMRRGRGSKASPSVVQDDDAIGGFQGRGYSEAASDFKAACALWFYIDGEPDTSGDQTDMPGRMEFAVTLDGLGGVSTRMILKNSGRLGVGTEAPSRIADFNSGAGNIIADGYDNHSLLKYKENVVQKDCKDMALKLKTFKLYEWNRKPLVTISELVWLAREHFELEPDFPGGDREWLPEKKFYNLLKKDDPIRVWMDEEEERLCTERRLLPEYFRKHGGLVADDPDTLAAVPDIISRDAEGNPIGFSTNEWVAFLHGCVLDLLSRLETVEAKASKKP